MGSSTAKNVLQIVDFVHTIHTLRLPHSMVLGSMDIVISSMLATIKKLDPGFNCNIILHSFLLLGREHHMCSDYEVPPVRGAIGVLLQILSAVILQMQLLGAVYKTNFF